MKELIKLNESNLNDEAVKTVNARELHEFLEVKSRYNDWFKNRVSEYGFSQDVDFLPVTKNLVSGGKQIEHYISLDMAKELSMVERNQKGKEARQYFISCEKKYKQLQPPKDTSSLPEFRKARAVTMMTKVADHICSRFPNLGSQSQQAVYASLVNPVAGDTVIPLPVLECKTYSATEVAEKLNSTSAMVGRIANRLDLKNEQYGIFVLDKSKHSDKQVETFRYNDEAIEIIASELTKH